KAETRQLDLEHTLNEVQLSKSACRKQLHKAMTFAKELVAEQETLLEALNMRQQENKAVKKFGTDMAQKMDTLKSQLKDVQKSAWQEFSTVEQRIHEQGDLIESMKDEHTKEIERLQQVIKEQEEKISKETKKEASVPVSPYKLFKDKYS
ncbi:coiled-coil domain-containing protein 38-like, partial [Sitophilus oryzae]|uniref:Coiled-coil domain-containing protein 38-like n=1 Tax=Sitophilus oryzae TaxID=7048 RepID=A0A6J2XE59_SITOR